MITIQDLYEALTDVGFDVYYGLAPNGTVAPYLVFRDIEHPNLQADDKTYFKLTELTLVVVEPYEHDFNLTNLLEETLDSLNVPYTSTEAWYPSEHIIETYYTIALYGGTRNMEES